MITGIGFLNVLLLKKLLMNHLMRRIDILFFALFLSANSFSASYGNDKAIPLSLIQGRDTVEIQILYNGRAWRNLYYKVKGDQFLFSNEFLSGTVTIDDRTFSNLNLRYDIYDDLMCSETLICDCLSE